MKKLTYCLCLLLITCTASAQTTVSTETVIHKTYPLQQGEHLSLFFDYPKLVRLSTWDKNEVAIEACLEIGGVKAEEVFNLNEERSTGTLEIRNAIDMDRIPNYYVITENGVKKCLSQEDFATYQAQNKSPFSYSQQKDIDIRIEIKVPAQTHTQLQAVYGIVELVGFEAPIQAEAKYGGIDLSLDEKKIGKIKLTNRYGKIYTNLALEPTEKEERNFYTSITATPGKGPDYDISSSYGNIYLRQTLPELRP